MADLTGVSLDPNVEESTGGFTLVTPGKYKAIIVKDSLTNNKSGTGKVWKILVQIVEGQFANESIKDYVNITHTSPKCQAIGQGTLKKICNLTGVQYPPQDTAGIIGRPLGIHVINEDFESNKEAGKMLKSAKIKAYIPLSEVTGAAQEAPAASTGTTSNEDW